MHHSSLPEKSEIQDRLRKRFLDRLGIKLLRIRRELVDRNWTALRTECRQIHSGGETFGYGDLVEAARRAEAEIPVEEIPQSLALYGARDAVDHLINVMDRILVEYKKAG